MRRVGSWLFGVVVVQGLALALLAAILPNFNTDGFDSLLVATLVISACQAIAWPIFCWVARLVHPLIFPILIFFFAGYTLRTGANSYLAYFHDPYSLAGSVSLFAADVIRER